MPTKKISLEKDPYKRLHIPCNMLDYSVNGTPISWLTNVKSATDAAAWYEEHYPFIEGRIARRMGRAHYKSLKKQKKKNKKEIQHARLIQTIKNKQQEKKKQN